MTKIRALTFSDMHLMRFKGDFKGIKGEMIRLIKGYDVVFYNGDTFELFYGKHLRKEEKSLEHAQSKAVKEALRKLEKLIKATPNTQHNFLLGNHEDNEEFKQGLRKLAAKYSNFNWNEHVMVFKDMVFLHGDLPMGGNPKQREEYPGNNLQLAKAYDTVCNSQEKLFLNLFDRTINSPQEVCKKTLEYLQLKHPHALENAKHIFIGHTHNPFTLKYKGYTFHNSGTLATETKRAHPIEMEIDMESGTTTVRDLPSHVLRITMQRAAKPGAKRSA